MFAFLFKIEKASSPTSTDLSRARRAWVGAGGGVLLLGIVVMGMAGGGGNAEAWTAGVAQVQACIGLQPPEQRAAGR